MISDVVTRQAHVFLIRHMTLLLATPKWSNLEISNKGLEQIGVSGYEAIVIP